MVSSLTRFNMDVYLTACSKERLNTQLKTHLSPFSISRPSKRCVLFPCFHRTIQISNQPPFPKKPTGTPAWNMWPTALDCWGLADGDQVQLTKSWQQNLALQHLGVLNVETELCWCLENGGNGGGSCLMVQISFYIHVYLYIYIYINFTHIHTHTHIYIYIHKYSSIYIHNFLKGRGWWIVWCIYIIIQKIL